MYNKHTLPCNLLICWTSFEGYNDNTQMHQKRTLLLQVEKILYPAFYKIWIFSGWRRRWEEFWGCMLLTAPCIENPTENQLKIII